MHNVIIVYFKKLFDCDHLAQGDIDIDHSIPCDVGLAMERLIILLLC